MLVVKLCTVIIITEGVQNRPCPDVPLWHVNYFVLKAMQTLSLGRIFCPSLNYLEESKLGPCP